MTTLFEDQDSLEEQDTVPTILDLDLSEDLFTPIGRARLNRIAAERTVILDPDPQDIKNEFVKGLLAPDPLAEKKRAVDARIQQKIEEIRAATSQAVLEEPSIAADNIEAGLSLTVEARALEQDPTAPERVYLEALEDPTKPLSLEEVERQELVGQHVMSEMLQTYADSVGLGDTVIDLVGQVFMPVGFFLDQADIERGLEAAGILNPGQSFKQFIDHFQAQPIERRVAAFPALIDIFKERAGIVQDNDLIAIKFLQSLIKAEGKRDLAEEEALEVALTGAGTAGSILFKLLRGTKKAYDATSPIATAKALGNDDLAGEMVAAGILDKEMADAVGISQVDLSKIAMGIDRTGVDASTIEGITPAMSKSLNENAKELIDVLLDVTTGRLLAREGQHTTKTQQLRTIRSEIEKLERDFPDNYNEFMELQGVKILDIDEGGYTLEARMRNSETGVIFNVPQRYEFKVSSNQGHFGEALDNFKGFLKDLASPALLAADTIEGGLLASAQRALRLDSIIPGIAKELNIKRAEVYKGLSKDSRNKVNKVLIEGDEYVNEGSTSLGKVFSPSELRVRGLTKDSEVEAYYKYRQYANTIYHISNEADRRLLVSLNYKSVNVPGVDLEGNLSFNSVYLKPIEDVEEAIATSAKLSSRSEAAVFRVYDVDAQEFIDLDAAGITEEYLKGRKVGSLLEEYSPPDGEGVFASHIIFKGESLREIPDIVKHRKEGWVPKLNKRAEWIIKENVPYTVNGTTRIRQETVGFAASKSDADRLVEEERALALDREEGVELELRDSEGKPIQRYVKVADRELTPEESLREEVGGTAGLVSGARSRRDLFYGRRGKSPLREDPMEAIQRATAIVTNKIGRNEARISDQAKWLNTVRLVFPDLEISDFNNTHVPLDGPKGKALHEMKQLIKAWNGIPTQDESFYQDFIQKIHDWALTGSRKIGFQSKDSVPFLLWLKHQDPASAMRAAAFHTLLGFANPIQLYVQAQAATIALSVFPTSAPQAVKLALQMGIMDPIKNQKAFKANLRVVAENPEEATLLERLQLDFHRTGQGASLRNNADTNAIEGEGLGLSNKVVRGLDTLNLFFYRRGEMFNRRLSFNLSYLDWLKNSSRNPDLKQIPDSNDLKEISATSNLNMLQLGRAYRAKWQGGADKGGLANTLGVMTQFGQVIAKPIEQAFIDSSKGGFTRAQKLRILTGQFAIFGAAGVPMGSAIINTLRETMGRGENLASPEENRMWAQGPFIGAFLNALDADIDLSNRAAIIGDLGRFVNDLVTGDSPAMARALGAFGTTATRTGDAISKLWPLAVSSDSFVTSPSPEKMRLLLRELGKITTTGGNLLQAYIMANQDALVNRYGDIIEYRDFNWSEELLTAFGAKPSILNQERAKRLTAKDKEELVSQTATAITSIAREWVSIEGLDNPESLTTLAEMLELLYGSFTNGDQVIEVLAREAVARRIDKPKTKDEETTSNYLRFVYPEKITGALQEDIRTFGQRAVSPVSTIDIVDQQEQ